MSNGGRPALAALLEEAFPNAANFPTECWVKQRMDYDFAPYSDAIGVVSLGPQRELLIKRVQDAHPDSKSHLDEYDDRVQDVLVEAEAFPWARDVARLGEPRFVESEGAPGLRCQRTGGLRRRRSGCPLWTAMRGSARRRRASPRRSPAVL